jgi:hypothetical protein
MAGGPKEGGRCVCGGGPVVGRTGGGPVTGDGGGEARRLGRVGWRTEVGGGRAARWRGAVGRGW